MSDFSAEMLTAIQAVNPQIAIISNIPIGEKIAKIAEDCKFLNVEQQKEILKTIVSYELPNKYYVKDIKEGVAFNLNTLPVVVIDAVYSKISAMTL